MADQILSYPTTESSIDRRNHAGLSTQIVLYVPDGSGSLIGVGAVQSMDVQESSSLKRVAEIDNGRTVEIIPQDVDKITLTINRLVFDDLTAVQALGAGFYHIRSQRIPFNIAVFNRAHSSNGCAGKVIRQTWYRNCWFESYGTSYSSSQYIISERATIQAQCVEELHPMDSPAGERGILPRIDMIESDYDQCLLHGAIHTEPIVDTPPEEGEPGPISNNPVTNEFEYELGSCQGDANGTMGLNKVVCCLLQEGCLERPFTKGSQEDSDYIYALSLEIAKKNELEFDYSKSGADQGSNQQKPSPVLDAGQTLTIPSSFGSTPAISDFGEFSVPDIGDSLAGRPIIKSNANCNFGTT